MTPKRAVDAQVACAPDRRVLQDGEVDGGCRREMPVRTTLVGGIRVQTGRIMWVRVIDCLSRVGETYI